MNDSHATPGAASAPEAHLYLVILEEPPPLDPKQTAQSEQALVEEGGPYGVEERIAILKRELLAKDELLQSTNEELETSNEELRSSNEELQTSKEELQSMNEELGTINAELQTRVSDLSRANNDMNNLLAGTGIGTVFVDHQLRILRFTTSASQIINLILSDVGRPLGHIVSNLVGYNSIVQDTQAVLDTLIPKEVDV